MKIGVLMRIKNMFLICGISVIGICPQSCCADKKPTPIKSKEKITEILGDPLRLSSYGKLQGIEAMGYFNVGKRYVHAPRVEFKAVESAESYEIYLVQKDRILGTTRTDRCVVFAEKGWDKILPGKAGVYIAAYDKAGQRIAMSGMFQFYVAPDFSPKVSAFKKRSYKDAAIKAFRALQSLNSHAGFNSLAPDVAEKVKYRVVLTAALEPDNTVKPFSYPNLHDPVYVEMINSMLKFADSELKKELMEFANSTGEHLLMCRIKDKDYVYRGLIWGCADFSGKAAIGMFYEPQQYERLMRMVEPAKCGYSGKALVKLYVTERG